MDAGIVRAASAPPAVDAGRDARTVPVGPPKRIFAKRFVVNVRTGANRDAPRIGYLRAGSVLEATTSEPISTEGCRGGWFELATGGFVCNGSDVIAFEGRRFPERRPAQPDMEAPLPYRFARTRRDNTPMYRRLPTDLEAAQYEGYRIPGMRLEHLPDGGVMAVPDTPAPEEADSEEAAGAEVASAPSAPSGPSAPSASSASSAPSDDPPTSVESLEAPEEEERVVRLNDLQGERDSVLQRRLVRGFIVSLDRDMRARARRYWRTLSNGFIPYSTQVEVRGSSFQGVALVRQASAERQEASAEFPMPITSRARAVVMSLPGGHRRIVCPSPCCQVVSNGWSAKVQEKSSPRSP